MNTKRILVFLIPIFIASLIYGYLQMPRQKRVSAVDNLSSPAKKGEPKQRVGANRNEGYPHLRSDLLERKSQLYPGVRRDLFFAGFAPDQYEEEISPAPFEAPPEEIVPPVVVPVTPSLPPPSAEEVANQDLSPYKFVGFFKKGEKQTIFLSSDGEIFLVHKGDYLGRDRKYYVLNITDTTMELRKEGTGDFSIKLTDQESLSAVALQGELKPVRAPAFTPRAVQPLPPGTAGRQMSEQEITLPDQQELLPVPYEEPKTEDQLQPEEDNNETQN